MWSQATVYDYDESFVAILQNLQSWSEVRTFAIGSDELVHNFIEISTGIFPVY